MPIATGDLKVKLTIKTGTAGNQSAQGDPNASLGKYISTTEVSGTPLNSIFDDISGAENAASTEDYRCVALHNAHATLPLTNAVAYLSGGDPAGGAVVTIAVDTTAASAVGSASAQGLEATTETAPGAGITGLSYSAPTTIATGLALGTIAAGETRFLWIKRAAANTAAVNAEQVTLGFTGDTGA